MMLLMFVTMAVTSAVLFWRLIHLDKNAPPGPFPLPLIGTLHAHSICPTPKQLQNLIGTYGNITSLFFGSKPAVVIDGNSCIREVLNNDSFADRGLADLHTLNMIMGTSGLFRADYTAKLKHDRKLVMHVFRKLGIGKPLMEERILFETDALVNHFKEKDGCVFNPIKIIHRAVLNNIMIVLVKERFSYDNEEANFMLDSMMTLSDSFISNAFIDKIPLLRHVPPFKWHIQSLLYTINGQIDILKRYTNKAIERFEHGRESCFVDFWLESHDKVVEIHDLLFTMFDLVGAGVESTAITLLWFLIYVTNRPNIQERIFDEINYSVGKSRQVGMDDKEGLPFLQAAILETFRYSTITPFIVRQSNNQSDVGLSNYRIKRGSLIFTNTYGVHFDGKTWNDPQVFRPQRFLNTERRFTANHNNLMMFGAGKRACPGESLANQELFLMAANLLHKFRFSVPSVNKRIHEEPRDVPMRAPRPFDIFIELR